MQKVLSLNTFIKRVIALDINCISTTRLTISISAALNNIMQTNYYKENLKGALQNLIKVNNSIFQSLIEVSVQGDLYQWNQSVPIGEVHEFSLELFKNSSDTNIQLLVKLY